MKNRITDLPKIEASEFENVTDFVKSFINTHKIEVDETKSTSVEFLQQLDIKDKLNAIKSLNSGFLFSIGTSYAVFKILIESSSADDKNLIYLYIEEQIREKFISIGRGVQKLYILYAILFSYADLELRCTMLENIGVVLHIKVQPYFEYYKRIFSEVIYQSILDEKETRDIFTTKLKEGGILLWSSVLDDFKVCSIETVNGKTCLNDTVLNIVREIKCKDLFISTLWHLTLLGYKEDKNWLYIIQEESKSKDWFFIKSEFAGVSENIVQSFIENYGIHAWIFCKSNGGLNFKVPFCFKIKK